MKVPLFTQRIFLFFHTEDIYFSHGVSRNITEFLDIDYNSDNFSVAISKERKSVTIRDSPCEERKTVILRDHPCEKKNRDRP